MIIQNYSDLAKDRGKINALKILTAGLESAMPQKQLQKIINSKQIQCGKKTINLTNYDSIYLVAFGKAADSMANAVSAIIHIKKGIVVIPKGLMPEIKNHRFQIFQAGHPTPDKTSVRAARCILKFLHQRNKDDLSSIASGTTYFDKTKFSDALKILKKHRLENKIPNSVIQRLRLGSSDKIPETPKKSKIPHRIVLTNSDCLQAMQKKSKQLGISFKTISISGDIVNATSKLVSLIPKKKNSCIIFGGETTVKVKGSGKGGRNQELVLRILEKIQKTKQDVTIASLGTDGIDSNTKYAGAITKNILIHQKEIKSYLTANASNSFFKKYGGLIKTGYTHTNLMDIGLILY